MEKPYPMGIASSLLLEDYSNNDYYKEKRE